jgi:hypothetical protein
MHGRDVVYAKHAHAGHVCDDVRGDRRRQAILHLTTGQAAQKRLTGGPYNHGPTERDDLIQARKQLEVVIDRLPEANPRVEHDPLLCHPFPDRERHPILEEGRNLADHVLVSRSLLHRPRLSKHVHQAAIGAGSGDHACHVGVPAQGAHIIDQRRTRFDRRPRDSSLRRVDRDLGCAVTTTQRLDHGEDSAELLRSRHGRGSRPGRLTSDVQDCSALLLQLASVSERRRRVEVQPAVRERVRRDVDNPHHGERH